MARLKVSKAARADLRAIFRQSAEMFGLIQADTYAESLRQAFELIAEYPRSAREREETNPVVRTFPHKAHVILYVADEQSVFVLRVRHAREDWLGDPLGSAIDAGEQP